MKKAVLFHEQMRNIFGDTKSAEPLLWMSSITLGIVMSKFVYDTMERNFSQSKAYRLLSRHQQIEWNNRGISTAHAITVSAIAGYLLVFSDFFSENAPYGPVVFRSTIFSQAILGVSIGYFISDLAMLLWSYPALGGFVYVLHHMLSIICLGLALHSGYAHIYLYLVLLTESTTPFVNMRWYLSVTGLSTSEAYMVNGILLFFSWLVFRVLLFVYFFVHVYFHYDQVKQLHNAAFYFMFTGPPLLALLNVFWFHKISTGLIKALKKKQCLDSMKKS